MSWRLGGVNIGTTKVWFGFVFTIKQATLLAEAADTLYHGKTNFLHSFFSEPVGFSLFNSLL